ncbi:MAG: LCP family protein [Actinobacteria bacterium]|nr:LCP family protein [Actinomycetota bacterium]
MRGGTRFRRLRRAAVALGTLGAVGAVAVGGTGLALYRTADAGLTRIPVSALEGKDGGQALNVLVVGSDSRDGLTREEELALKLGSFEGQRSDTVILASITPDQQGVSLVSFPRDLLVLDDDGDPHKLTETFFEGPDHVVDIVASNFGIPVHHYAEISILGFLGVVETLGAVEICLDESLRDRKSGADFEAGCHAMDPEEALSYVRSRQGARGDFERIERQQVFLKAMLSEMVSSRTLTDVPKLFRVVERVADNVTTDDGLDPATMRTLAEELRGLASGDVPMVVVPGYTRTIGGKSYVVAYRPGAEALFASIRDGEVLAPRGSKEERLETSVAIWTGGRADGTDVVASTLNYSGFSAASAGPGEVDAGATTRVYVVPGFEDQAGWVGATLGAPVQSLPVGIEPPEGAQVVVAVGDDATS